jgi:predicted nucleotidyltransferase
VDRKTIESSLREVGADLLERGITGDIVIVGGAFMTLVLRSRDATKDVDAYLDPRTAQAIREAAARVASRRGLPEDWLNDAVKGYFASAPDTVRWAEYPGLRVDAVSPAYLFAMKAFAGRPQDIEDLKALARHLGIETAREAIDIVTTYVPDRLLTPRVRYLLDDLFAKDDE